MKISNRTARAVLTLGRFDLQEVSLVLDLDRGLGVIGTEAIGMIVDARLQLMRSL
jgi:hypothetical protein